MLLALKNNAKGARANIDAVHDNPNNNLMCYHDSRFWDVPGKFVFLKNALLKCGWIAWLKGFLENRECNDEMTVMKPIEPLRLMNSKLLPKKLCSNLLNEISPKMNLMEDAPEVEMHQNAIADEDFIDKSFEHGLNNVKRTVQHVLLKKWINWKASCFCKMTKHPLIMKKEQKVMSFVLKQTRSSTTVRGKGNN